MFRCGDLDGLVNEFPESIYGGLDPTDLNYYRFVILGLVRGEDDEDSFLVLHVPGKVIAYKFATRTRFSRNFVIFLRVNLILNGVLVRIP